MRETAEFPWHRAALTVIVMALVAAALTAWLIHALAAEPEPPTTRVKPYPFALRESTVAAELADLERRVQRQPDSAVLRAQLAQAHLAARNFAAAEKEAQHSLALLANPMALAVLGHVCQARHQFQESLTIANDLLRRDSSSTDAQVLLITGYVALGRASAAVMVAERLVSRLPTAAAYLQRALVYEAVGRDVEAEFDFVESCNRAEVGEQGLASKARTLYGRFLLRRGRWEEAEGVLREARRIEPRNHAAAALLGETLALAGRYAEAKPWFEAAHAESQEPIYWVRQARFAPASEAQKLRQLAEAQLRNPPTRPQSTPDVPKQGSWRPLTDAVVPIALSQSGTVVPIHHGDSDDGAGHARRDLSELLLDWRRKLDAAEAVTLLRAELEVRRDTETLRLLADALRQTGQVNEAWMVAREALSHGVQDARLYALAAAIESEMGNSRRADLFRHLAKTVNPRWR